MDLVSPPLGDSPTVAADAIYLRATVARLQDEVARLRAEREMLAWAVGHDELTGLANRRLFATLLPRLLDEDRAAAVVVLDLNGFKPINDTYGHETGDEVLRVVSRRMDAWGNGDLVARLGGDEFAGVLTGGGWRSAIAILAATIAQPIPVLDRSLRVTASIGVAPTQRGTGWVELLRRADLAMYQAKASRSCFAVWGNDAQATGRSTHIRRSLEFTLYTSNAPG
jgi:diguanylate cyclase (GGDEF)-like protein